MSISKEAIEAAARALHEFNPTFAQDKWDATELDYRSWRREQAIAALTAAAPAIQAAALRGAADAADDPSPDEMDFYQIDQAQAGNWLRARAATIEGESE